MSEERILKTLCRMCDDHCGIDVHLKDNQIVKIEGNRDHVWNRGRICIKGSHGLEMFYSPQRLKKPLKKTANGFVEIPLEQALDEIAEKIKKIQAQHGERAVGVWKGEALGFSQQEEMARRWIQAIGSPNYFSNDSACFASRWIGYSLVYGRQNGQPDFENSDCIVIFGANPPHSHPNMTQQINRARAKGADLVVIDVRFSAIARQADTFVQIKPGTDAAFALGLARELIRNDWIDHNFLDNYTLGFNQFSDYVQKFTYDYVSKETGCNAEILIQEVAKRIKKSMPHTVFFVGNGLEHHENGVNTIRTVACLDGLVGSLDQKGGNYSPVPFPQKDLTLYEERPLQQLDPIGASRFPVMYEYRHECHSMTLMNTILTGTPYPFKALVVTGANPALTNPNSKKVRKALSALDLFVVREIFLTETAQLADYVLPAASFLERSELHTHGGFQTVNLTTRVLQPDPEVQDEYQFFHDLAWRLDAGKYFPWENEDKLNEWLVSDTGVSIQTLQAHPSGYHYAEPHYKKHIAKQAAGEKAFNTPSGKLEFVSAYLKEKGFQELPEYIPPKSNTLNLEYPFTMVTGARKMMYCHGRGHNLPALSQALKTPEIEMNGLDAKKLDVVTGDPVKVTAPIGELMISVRVMEADEIGSGVVQITHGWESNNVNNITHDDRFDPISGFPLMKAVQVKIEKV